MSRESAINPLFAAVRPAVALKANDLVLNRLLAIVSIVTDYLVFISAVTN